MIYNVAFLPAIVLGTFVLTFARAAHCRCIVQDSVPVHTTAPRDGRVIYSSCDVLINEHKSVLRLDVSEHSTNTIHSRAIVFIIPRR